MLNNIRIAVITPLTEGQIFKQFHKSVLGLKKPKGVIEMLIKTPDSMEIDTALNTSVCQALEHKVDYILFWEADQTLPPETLQYLLDDDKDVVSGLYFQKEYPYLPVIYNYVPSQKNKYIMSSFYNYDDGYEGKKGLRKVDVAGCGCLLVKAEVFSKIQMPYFKFLRDLKSMPDGTTISADNYFCRQLYEVNIPVYVDTRVCCGHLAVKEVGEDDWLRSKKLFLEEYKQGKHHNK